MSDPDLAYTIARFRPVAVESLLRIARDMSLTLEAALIQTPDAFAVARVDGASLISIENDGTSGGHERAVDLSRAYEIRAFGAAAELRWTRDGVAGDAVLLGGDATIPASEEFPLCEPLARGVALAVLTRLYRVWGDPRATQVSAGWSVLGTGRVGRIVVPFADAGARGVALEAKEYVVKGEGGNAVVLFERLVRFTHASATVAATA